MNDMIIITKNNKECGGKLMLQIPEGKNCGKKFVFKEIDLGISTHEEELLPHRKMRGRLSWDADSYTALFEEYGKGRKNNRVVKRTDHARCVIRKDGTYHIGVRTVMRNKIEKQALLAELIVILEAIEKDISQLRREAAKSRKKENNKSTGKED